MGKQKKFSDYCFDLDKISEFCLVNNGDVNTKKNQFRQQEISNNYQLNESGDLALSEKIVHEVLTPQEAPIYDELKVDLVKGFLQVILSEKQTDNIGLPSFSVPGLLAIQTFVNYGFLKENK